MKSRAAVAVEAGKPLEITQVDVQGPQHGADPVPGMPG